MSGFTLLLTRKFQIMRCLIIFGLFPLFTFAQVNTALQETLIKMESKDQHIRNEMISAGWQNITKELVAKQTEIDEANTAKLKAIIKKHSWVTRELVGVEGVNAAFLILQHSTDIAFKERMLPILKQSYLQDGGITGQQVALLTDRVLIAKGKKQIYGTQADLSKGQIVIGPIEDEANVDKRRAEMELPALAYYKKLLEKAYGIKDYPELEH